MGLSKKQVQAIIKKNQPKAIKQATARKVAKAQQQQPFRGIKRIGAALDSSLRAGLLTTLDPGNGGTIHIEFKGQAFCEAKTAGVETRILPPAKNFGVGQELTVMLKIDGGDLTITGAADGSVVLEDAGDQAIFRVSAAGEGRAEQVWRVIHESDASSGGTIAGTTGAADNAILRADGVGGATIQASSVFISDIGWINTDGGSEGGLTVDANDTVLMRGETGQPVIIAQNPDGTNGCFIVMPSVASGVDANLFIGPSTGLAVGATATRNIGLGPSALTSLSTGDDNVAIGTSTLATITTASGNIAIGWSALTLAVGFYNVGIGLGAAENLSAGSGNVCIGLIAGDSLTSGSNNVFIGESAGVNLATGSRNICIGYVTTLASGNDQLNIGNLVFGDLAAREFEIRASTNPTKASVYRTYTSSTSFERLRIYVDGSNDFRIETQKGSGGGTARALVLGTDGTGYLMIAVGGTIFLNTISVNTAGLMVFPDGVRQTFNPSSTTPGFNVGAVSSTPSSRTDGDMWYNLASNTLDAQINSIVVSLVGGTTGATDNALIRANGTGGLLLQGSAITVDDTGVFTFPDDVRQTFNPGSTNSGLNVGSLAGDPSAPSNGDIWYDSTANELTARINGVNTALKASTWDQDITSTGDETATNAQNQDHTELQFAVLSGEAWYVRVQFGMSGNNTTGDCAANLVTTGTWNTTASYNRGIHYGGTGTLTTRAATAAASTTNMVASPGLTVNNGDGVVRAIDLEFDFVASADGTVKVQFGLVNAAAARTCTLHKGARLTARRIRTP